MRNYSVQFFLALTICLICVNAIADEVFWIAQIETPYKDTKDMHPWLESADNIQGASSKITIQGNKLMLNINGCNVTINKISPFSVSRTLLDLINDAGGDTKFKSFLKNKLHTDMSQWKTEYFVKVPEKNAGGPGCEAIQSSLIYRSADELILTDTSFFYRLILRKEKRVEDIKSINGYAFSPTAGNSCVEVTKKFISEKINYCAYSDDVDTASLFRFKYKCYRQDGVNHYVNDYPVNDFQIYDSKKKCIDDYNEMKERDKYQG